MNGEGSMNVGRSPENDAENSPEFTSDLFLLSLLPDDLIPDEHNPQPPHTRQEQSKVRTEK
jgi:hypothetical protein